MRSAAREWSIHGESILRLAYWAAGIVGGLAVTIIAARAIDAPTWFLWLVVIPTAATAGLAITLLKTMVAKTRQWEDGRDRPTNRGDNVRSNAEARIANWLFARGYQYEYEARICGYRPDFYLTEYHVIIEYWGLDTAEYWQRRREKVRAYQRAGYPVISSEGWHDIETELERKMRAFDEHVYRRAPNRRAGQATQA